MAAYLTFIYHGTLQLDSFQEPAVGQKWRKICKVFHGWTLFANSILAVIPWSKLRSSVVAETLIRNLLKILTALPLP